MTVKVLEFRREGWRDPVATLRAIAVRIESGDLPACKVGTMVMMGEGGEVEAFGFGPAVDDLQTLALLRLGEQRLVDVMLELD